jgi:hypothetical protein
VEVSQEAFERFQTATKAAQLKIAELVLDLKKAEDPANQSGVRLQNSTHTCWMPPSHPGGNALRVKALCIVS